MGHAKSRPGGSRPSRAGPLAAQPVRELIVGSARGHRVVQPDSRVGGTARQGLVAPTSARVLATRWQGLCSVLRSTPVLKHGPRSLTYMQVERRQTRAAKLMQKAPRPTQGSPQCSPIPGPRAGGWSLSMSC